MREELNPPSPFGIRAPFSHVDDRFVSFAVSTRTVWYEKLGHIYPGVPYRFQVSPELFIHWGNVVSLRLHDDMELGVYILLI